MSFSYQFEFEPDLVIQKWFDEDLDAPAGAATPQAIAVSIGGGSLADAAAKQVTAVEFLIGGGTMSVAATKAVSLIAQAIGSGTDTDIAQKNFAAALQLIGSGVDADAAAKAAALIAANILGGAMTDASLRSDGAKLVAFGIGSGTMLVQTIAQVVAILAAPGVSGDEKGVMPRQRGDTRLDEEIEEDYQRDFKRMIEKHYRAGKPQPKAPAVEAEVLPAAIPEGAATKQVPPEVAKSMNEAAGLVKVKTEVVDEQEDMIVALLAAMAVLDDDD